MSRPDLYDLAIDHGGLDLIPEDLCREMHVGVKTAWAVFVHRLLYADSAGVMSWGTQSIADKLRLDRIRVRECDELLVAAGLMRVVGKRVRGRTTSYRMLPDVLDAIAAAHEQDDGQPEPEPPDNTELARGVGTESWHGELARKVGTESVAKKGREVKLRGSTRAKRATPQPPPFLTECPTHGLDNGFDGPPCGTCKEARQNREIEEQHAIDRARALSEPIDKRGLALIGNVFGMPA